MGLWEPNEHQDSAQPEEKQARQRFNHVTATAKTTRSRPRKKFWFLFLPTQMRNLRRRGEVSRGTGNTAGIWQAWDSFIMRPSGDIFYSSDGTVLGFLPLWLPPSFLLRHAQSLYVQTVSTVMRPSNSKYLPAKRASANSSRSDLKRPNSLFQRSCWQHQTFSGLSPLLGLPSDSLLNIPHGAKNSQKMNLRKNQ
jgi:hypothetical protein